MNNIQLTLKLLDGFDLSSVKPSARVFPSVDSGYVRLFIADVFAIDAIKIVRDLESSVVNWFFYVDHSPQGNLFDDPDVIAWELLGATYLNATDLLLLSGDASSAIDKNTLYKGRGRIEEGIQVVDTETGLCVSSKVARVLCNYDSSKPPAYKDHGWVLYQPTKKDSLLSAESVIEWRHIADGSPLAVNQGFWLGKNEISFPLFQDTLKYGRSDSPRSPICISSAVLEKIYETCGNKGFAIAPIIPKSSSKGETLSELLKIVSNIEVSVGSAL